MKSEYALLVGVLARAVANRPLEIPKTVDWQRFLRLAKAHNVEALAYHGLEKADIPTDVRNTLSVAFHSAIFRDAQLEYYKNNLKKALTHEQIPHIFLKGAALKYSYPVPALRTMCDLDVLVHTGDYPTIDRIAKTFGGVPAHGDGNHHNFRFPGGVEVEFHPNLLHHATPVGSGINPGWQYAKGNTLTPEGFYLNTICHLANHFVTGGVGVRFVLDVWVNRYLCKPSFDREIVERELTKFDLLDFARNIEALSDWWFGDGEKTPLLEELGLYILTSGSYGQTERAVLNAISLSGGKGKALWGKVFYPKEELEDRFPWCKGKPWLLPAAWCARAFRAVTRHGRHIRTWGEKTGGVPREQVTARQEKLCRFGIRNRK